MPETRTPARPRWTVYALGGGMGHLTRALALARRAARGGEAVRILTNSPYAPLIAERRCRQLLNLESGIEWVLIPGDDNKDQVAERVRRIFLKEPPPDVCVIDTFPRGLAGELEDLLPSLPSLKVLVHRDLNPDYVRWADLRSFAACYDLLLVPGEDAPLEDLPRARRTDPWLVCDSHELLSPVDARAELGLAAADERPLVVVVGTGNPQESLAAAHAARRLAESLADRTVTRLLSCDPAAFAVAAELGISLWPLLAVLPGIDLLLGAGGYNTVHEAQAIATPLLAIAQPRLYDRQAHRLLPHQRFESWEAATNRAVEWFAVERSVSERNRMYSNGVEEAWRLIDAAT